MDQITVYMDSDRISNIINFINKYLNDKNCNSYTIFKIDIAIEEILSNIAKYAYGSVLGKVTIKYGFCEKKHQLVIKFIDEGAPYNPIRNKNPDITLPALEREEGGLGIYLAKMLMDSIEYKYIDKNNILTIKKQIQLEAKNDNHKGIRRRSHTYFAGG